MLEKGKFYTVELTADGGVFEYKVTSEEYLSSDSVYERYKRVHNVIKQMKESLLKASIVIFNIRVDVISNETGEVVIEL